MNIVDGRAMNVTPGTNKIILSADDSTQAQQGIIKLNSANDLENKTGLGNSLTFKELKNYTPVMKFIPDPDAGKVWRSGQATSDTWQDVIYVNDKKLFVAVGYSGAIAYSSNGINWTKITVSTVNWRHIVYAKDKGMFVVGAQTIAAQTTNFAYSYDGKNWTTRSSYNADGFNSINALTYGNGVFIAGTNTNNFRISYDGITWSSVNKPSNQSFFAACYALGLFVFPSSNNNVVLTSPNASTWTSRTGAGAVQTWQSICYGDKFVAVASTGTNRVMTSFDSITWASRASANNGLLWMRVCYGNGLFVAVADVSTNNNNNIMTSPDGITWTLRSSVYNTSNINNHKLYGVCYGNGLFVAVGSSQMNVSGTFGGIWGKV